MIFYPHTGRDIVFKMFHFMLQSEDVYTEKHYNKYEYDVIISTVMTKIVQKTKEVKWYVIKMTKICDMNKQQTHGLT